MRRLASVLLAAAVASAAVSASAADPAQTGAASVTENTRSAAAAAVGKAAQSKQPTPEEILKTEHDRLLNDLLVALSEHGDVCDEAMAAVAKLDYKQRKFALETIRSIMASLPDTMDGAKPEAVAAAKTEAALRIVSGAMRIQNGIPAEAAFKSPEKASGK